MFLLRSKPLMAPFVSWIGGLGITICYCPASRGSEPNTFPFVQLVHPHLMLKHSSHLYHPRALALAALASQNTLPPDICMACSLYFFRSLLKCIFFMSPSLATFFQNSPSFPTLFKNSLTLPLLSHCFLPYFSLQFLLLF